MGPRVLGACVDGQSVRRRIEHKPARKLWRRARGHVDELERVAAWLGARRAALGPVRRLHAHRLEPLERAGTRGRLEKPSRSDDVLPSLLVQDRALPPPEALQGDRALLIRQLAGLAEIATSCRLLEDMAPSRALLDVTHHFFHEPLDDGIGAVVQPLAPGAVVVHAVRDEQLFELLNPAVGRA